MIVRSADDTTEIPREIEILHGEMVNRLRPDDRARALLDNVINELFIKIKQVIKDLNFEFQLEPILVGSTAKDTFLAEPDIDVFIMFPTTVSVDKLREQGLILGRKVLPDGEERYAEHPYISGKFSGFKADIVPCYKLDNVEDKMTAVDRTPFHTEYIKKHLRSEQHDEIRLLKQFMKGIGAYGAEIEIQGFSGYLCELLILKYGSFFSLVDAATTWSAGMFLSLDNSAQETSSANISYQPRSKLSKKLAEKFKNEPLVFIDPVDRSRNVASAVGDDKFKLFIFAAQTYLKNPKREFFFPNHVTPLALPQLKNILDTKPGTIIGVKFRTPPVVPDILHGQLHKCLRVIQKLFDCEGFGVKQAEYYQNKQTVILFELAVAKLPDVLTHRGPPESHENVNAFISKWNDSSAAVSKPYLKAQRWFVDIKREFTIPSELLKANIFKLSLGNHIRAEIGDRPEIYQGPEVLQDGFEHALTLFLDPKYSWEY